MNPYKIHYKLSEIKDMVNELREHGKREIMEVIENLMKEIIENDKNKET